MTTYLFFYDSDVSKEYESAFEIKADNSSEAFDKAYDIYGPQVEDMYYREKDES